MEAIAKLKNVPTSPRKMRYVVDLIRNKPVAAALSTLQYMDQSGSYFVDKLLRSAIANWQAKNPELNLEDANLHVTRVFVDGGRVLKRLRVAPQGRAHRIRKRSNHITLAVDSIA
jgi:large subunit ribosomal protein L22